VLSNEGEERGNFDWFLQVRIRLKKHPGFFGV
jgi:hypothetical protein